MSQLPDLSDGQTGPDEITRKWLVKCPNCNGTGWHRERVSYPPHLVGMAVDEALKAHKCAAFTMEGCPLCQRAEDRHRRDRAGTGQVAAMIAIEWRRGQQALETSPA